MTITHVVGDTRRLVRLLPKHSVDLLATSPPFLGLRSYLDDDDPAKADEIGMEPSPAEFLEELLLLTDEWARVLTLGGSIAVELGDSSADTGGSGGDYNEGGMREGQPTFAGSAAAARGRRDTDIGRNKVGGDERPGGHHLGGDGWPLGKSLCFIPQLYGASLAYGRNLLTGEAHTRWRVRNVVTWCRTNPTPGAQGDKFRRGTSDIVIACLHRARHWDVSDLLEPYADSPGNRYPRKISATDAERRPGGSMEMSGDNRITAEYDPADSDGVVPLDWWVVPANGPKRSPVRSGEVEHYATWPETIPNRLIRAMCPPHGLVLDPFSGSGTTLAAAQGLGRRGLGFDLDRNNAILAREQVGMFLEVIDASADNGAAFGAFLEQGGLGWLP